MNSELLNPFAQDFPESYDPTLTIDGAALCVRFSRTGRFAGQMVAVGRYDGVVSVYDFYTREVLRAFEGHVKAISCVCWSKDGRVLLSASKDWNVILWDLSPAEFEDERRETIRFDAPVNGADLHPSRNDTVVVTLQSQVEPILVTPQGRWKLEWGASSKENNNTDNGHSPRASADQDQDQDSDATVEDAPPLEFATSVTFSPSGDWVLVGTSAGRIHVFDVRSKAHVATHALGVPNAVRSLEFDATGQLLLTNSTDRCLRVIRFVPDADGIPTFSVTQRLQDMVNRTPWNAALFSADGEYVIGGAASNSAHNIYIWYTSTGGLVKVLEGPSDPLHTLDWHPLNPVILSVSAKGFLYTWRVSSAEKWGAYAPGFVELDENIMYDEKEDEFDVEDASAKLIRKRTEEDKAVDLLPHDTDSYYPLIELDTDYLGEAPVAVVALDMIPAE